jgi:hypothetical protein
MGNFIPKQYQMLILFLKLAFKNYNAPALGSRQGKRIII